MSHHTPTYTGYKTSALAALIESGVEVLALDSNDVPHSRQAIACRDGHFRPRYFSGIGLVANGRQVVVRAAAEAALRHLLAMADDPLALALAPRVGLKDGVIYLILGSDGGLRAGDLGPGLRAIASYAPLHLGNIAVIEGGGPPPVIQAILNRLQNGEAAEEQADIERESLARTGLTKAPYPTGSSDLESILASVDILQAIGFSTGDCEMHLSERWPDEALSPAIERAVTLAFGQGRAGHACEDRPSVDWILEPLLPREAAGLLVAPSRAGKTFVGVDLALAAASGGSFFNHRFDGPLGAVILSGEGAETVEPRLVAMAAARNLDLGELAIIHGPCLRSGEVWPLVRRAHRRIHADFGFGLGVIILDGLATIYGVDEDDEREATKIMGDLRRLAAEHEALSLLIHHSGRRGPAARGSTAWTAAANFEWQIGCTISDGTGSVTGRRLRQTKNRLGQELDLGPFHICKLGGVLRLGPDPREAPSPRAKEARPAKAISHRAATAPKSLGPDERLRRALATALANGQGQEIDGRICVSLDVLRVPFLDGRSEPRYEKNLRSALLSAAVRIGTQRIDHAGLVYLVPPTA